METRVLLVNCYLEKRGEKIRPYIAALLDAAAGCGREVVVTGQDDERIASGATVHRHMALVIAGADRVVSRGGYHAGFLDFLRCRRIPVLGIGYGHRLLARAYGATVEDDEAAGPPEVVVKPVAADPLLAGLEAGCTMRLQPGEVVRQDKLLLRHFRVLAHDGNANVLAMRHQKLPFWGVQFHPERSGEAGRRLLANFLGQVG